MPNAFDLAHRALVTGLAGFTVAGLGFMVWHTTGIKERSEMRKQLVQEQMARGEYVEPTPPPTPEGIAAHRDPKDTPLNDQGRLIYQMAEEMVFKEAQQSPLQNPDHASA